MPVSTDYEAVEKNAVKMIYPPVKENAVISSFFSKSIQLTTIVVEPRSTATPIFFIFSAILLSADILTGAEVLEIGKQKAYDLLVDLGTNGEILLLNKDSGVASISTHRHKR